MSSSSRGRVAHVGAVGRGRAPGDPEQPEQAHHVVDPQPAGVAERGPDGLHERLVAGGPQPPGVERRQAPVLAPGVELVGRGADGHVEGEHVLPQPGVGAAGVDAHRQVVHDRHAGRRRRLQLEVDQPLQPLVEADPVGGARARRPPPRAGRGGGSSSGHACQSPAVLLDQGAEGGVGVERRALRRPPPVERRIAGEGVPHLLEGVELEPPHRVPVDEALAVEGPAGAGQLVEAAAEGGRARRARPPPAGRAGCGSGGCSGSRGWPTAGSRGGRRAAG